MRECCEKLFLTLFYSFKNMGDTSNQEGKESLSFMLQAMQQQFACMDVVFNEIRDQMDMQDAVIAAWCKERPQRVPNARRQERRVPMDDSNDDHADVLEDEEDQASLNGEGKFVPRGEGRGRGFRRDSRWRDGTDINLGRKHQNEDTVVPRENLS